MSLVVVGIGDCKMSAEPNDTLVTYALGSCIGVMIYDSVAQVGGLLHILLPDSRLDSVKAQNKPFVFADTGIPLLFHQAYALGARKERLVVRLAGGSQMSMTGGVLNVGIKNIQSTRLILSRAGVKIQSEATGGRSARTVRLNVKDGQMLIQETAISDKKALLSSLVAAHG